MREPNARPLESPVCIINFITDALSDLFHRVKLVVAGFLSWGLSRPGFPQSQIRALSYVTDFAPRNVLLWKYIQNTTVSEVVPKGTDFRRKISRFALTKVYLYI